MRIDTRFSIRDRVHINGDRNGVVATVQRIFVTLNGTSYEASWFDSSGAFREHQLYEWQLEKIDDTDL